MPVTTLTTPLLPSQQRPTVCWGQLYGASASLAVANAAAVCDHPLLVIANDARSADRLIGELRFFSSGRFPVHVFPDWETLPYDHFSPYQDIISQRLATLAELPKLRRGLIVVALSTLIQRLPPHSYIANGSLFMATGESIDRDEMARTLEAAGYIRVPQVNEHGEFAVRGSLLDLYPMGCRLPFRIDLLDDEIDSIRCFDSSTQRSVESVDQISLLPAREFPMTPAAIDGFRRRYRQRFEGDPSRSLIYRDVSAGIAPAGIEYYLPLFFEQTTNLFDYLTPDTGVVCFTGYLDELSHSSEELQERFGQRAHDIERPILRPEEICLQQYELIDLLHTRPRIVISDFELEPSAQETPHLNYGSTPPPSLRFDSRADEPAQALIEFCERFDDPVLFVAESAGRRETLLEILRRRHIDTEVVEDWDEFVDKRPPCAITIAPIESGLMAREPRVAVIAEEQLFGDRVRRRRHRSARDPESLIRDLTDLTIGAPVVHEEHGVGRYQGLSTLKIGDVATEFLTVEYAGSDRLYVPVHALHFISRYTGAAPENAPLHRLGGEQWAKVRRRATERVRDVAAELLEVYARRAARRGIPYPIDEQAYRGFEADFPFEETPDQAQAVDAVIQDMRSGTPMDRVVCGDVGFGKTEVALRASFVAAYNSKQVAILVPTTLLAQQHYQTFSDRFADWPVRVACLSRFRTRKEINAILAGVKDGTIDIVIGTHRLLQGDVEFKDLGLLVIDEEHRFGVRHKERFKSLRAEVDVLTLTATPIPRTLNMALGGLRELSLITTPPAERLAVKTFVCEWNAVLIREACLREIKRGGQLYFVHNKVQTIEKTARELRELVPEATIRVAHGQMRERDLEQVMLDFYHRRFNVLVCSTIIESGLDVPTANTIVINQADHLGLAQLHQLRGRVGRSHHRAYAYLVTPPRGLLTADAEKRLAAIESMEDLGAGFVLATHDLEIRGAGELLGDVQSGQIQEIGFTLYLELLERAVRALKAGTEPDLERPLEHRPEIDLRIPALIPEDYMPDVHMRLIMYKRIASTKDEDELRNLKVELIDRFGVLPDATKTLFRLTSLKLKAEPLGIRSIKVNAAGGGLLFNEEPNIDPLAVVQLIQREPQNYRFDGQNRLRFTRTLETGDARIAAVEDLIDQLSTRAAA